VTRRVAAPCLVLLAACGGGVGPSRGVDLGQPFQLAVGETVAVDEGALSLTFVGVVSDSRCPIDAVCIVAGDALLQLRVRQQARSTQLIELTSPSRPRGRADGYEIEALSLLPAPRASVPIPPNAYVAGLVVRRP